MEWNDSYTRAVVETRGNVRAVVIRDEDSSGMEPDWDGQATVLRYDYRTWDVESKTGTDEGDTLAHALSHFLYYYGSRRGLETFKRYARIFHGTRDFRTFHYSYSPDSVEYMALDSAAARTAWGYDGDDGAEGTAHDWQAYIDGDVYGVAIERRVNVRTVKTADGETLSDDESDEWDEDRDTAVWGHYGEDWAVLAARDLLNDYTRNG